MKSTWSQIELDAEHVHKPLPDLTAILNEAQALHEDNVQKRESYVYAYLRDERWGKIMNGKIWRGMYAGFHRRLHSPAGIYRGNSQQPAREAETANLGRIVCSAAD